MASIARAEVIGVRTAENTIGSTTFTSTVYCVLVEYTTGAREVVETDSKGINRFAPFLTMHPDGKNLLDMLEKYELKLEHRIREVESQLQTVVHGEVNRVFTSLKPLPEVAGLPERTAVQRLQAAGFQVRLVNQWPQGLPEGTVHSVSRAESMLMTALLDVRHPLPNVVGRPESEALRILQQAGFDVIKQNQWPAGLPDGVVRAVQRPDELRMAVRVDIRHPLPDTAGLTAPEAEKKLQAAGFAVTVKKQFATGQPDDAVLSLSRPEELEMRVNLVAAVHLPDVKGLRREEAEKVLQGIPAKVIFREKYTDIAEKGRVISWEEKDGVIAVDVSKGASQLRCDAEVEIRSDDPELSALRFAAAVTFSRLDCLMSLSLLASGGKKVKVQLPAAAQWVDELNSRPISAEVAEFVSDGKNSLSGEPFARATLKLPDSRTPRTGELRMTVSVGLLKRQRQVSFRLSFHWPDQMAMQM